MILCIYGRGIYSNKVKTGISEVGESISPTLKNEILTLGKRTGVDVSSPVFGDVLDITKPTLSKKETASTLAKGNAGKATGLLRTPTLKPTARDIKVAGAVSDLVDPEKLLVENIDAVKNAQVSEAQNLAASIKEMNIPLNAQEFASHLDAVETPVLLQSDKTLSNAYKAAKRKMVDAVAKAGAEGGSDLSTVLQARKDFDAFVSGQFPDLYESDRLTPMRKALDRKSVV